MCPPPLPSPPPEGRDAWAVWCVGLLLCLWVVAR